jgi:hypothetical protein
MKKSASMMLLFLTLLTTGQISAQEADTTMGWTHQLASTLNLTQASFDNWQAGGENTLAWQALLNGRSTLISTDWRWQNTGKFTIGYNKTGDQGTRKSFDEMKVESVLSKLMSKNFHPYASFTFRSQFAPGYEYDDDNNRTQVSAFMDPGFFNESIGIGYLWKDHPVVNIESRLGAGLKQTTVKNFLQYTDDPSTEKEEKVRSDAGVSWVSEIGLKMHENIVLQSQLDLFFNLKGDKRTDVFWENLITMTVTKVINVTFNFDVLYDENISDRRQIRQQLAVGFTYNFL